MATERQIEAARHNIKKAQASWQAMSHKERSAAQPGGRQRAKPGNAGGGEFFHIQVRPKQEFKAFRTQDVGKKGGIERVSGRRASGSWDTQKWLISKEFAHLDGHRLIADTDDAREILEMLGSTPEHIRGDRFKAQDRPNVPEKDKPTPPQKHARSANIKKAQASRAKH